MCNVPNNSFVIHHKLPSLNEYINACRRNRYAGAKFKADTEALIEWEIKNAVNKKMLTPTDKPCRLHFIWHEKTAKRDCDNIASAKKYILDALQKQGIIKNDNQKYITGFTDEFIKDTTDYVVVEFETEKD